MSDCIGTCDQCTERLEAYKSECFTLKAEVTRLSGKTGFCTECEANESRMSDISDSCMELVKERDALKAELERAKSSWHTQEVCQCDRWRGIAETLADKAGAITESIAFTEGTKTNSEMPKWLLARGEDLKKALSLYDEAVK